MRSLSDEGLKQAEAAAERHHVSCDAVVTLLQALDRGNGVQAQFSHPDLGGLGQWSRGGMIMLGDMFDTRLKARVDHLCTDLSDLLQTRTMFEPTERGGTLAHGSVRPGSASASGWWPDTCGTPSSSGSQNDMRYACFPETRRLAIEQNGVVSVYDTGDHKISGVSQQQSGSQSLAFTSQHGTVRLEELARVNEGAPKSHARDASTTRADEAFGGDAESFRRDQPKEGAPQPQARAAPVKGGPLDDDVFAKIERLHDLQQRGILSEAECADKRKELLARI